MPYGSEYAILDFNCIHCVDPDYMVINPLSLSKR